MTLNMSRDEWKHLDQSIFLMVFLKTFSCKPGDEFLVVDDESHSDWMLVTSVQTRQSGYLPKFCLEVGLWAYL